jgi:hypothetical protein
VTSETPHEYEIRGSIAEDLIGNIGIADRYVVGLRAHELRHPGSLAHHVL